jgi:hypothetical protein
MTGTLFNPENTRKIAKLWNRDAGGKKFCIRCGAALLVAYRPLLGIGS